MINDKDALNAIHEATQVFRKGGEVTRKKVGNIEVVEVFGYPETKEATKELELHDLYFVDVGVDKPKAAELGGAIREWLDQDDERAALMANGPSYIHMGEWMEQETALRLFAIGASLGWWKIMNASFIGLDPGMGGLYAIPTKDVASEVPV
jgi:hypothetical protein